MLYKLILAQAREFTTTILVEADSEDEARLRWDASPLDSYESADWEVVDANHAELCDVEEFDKEYDGDPEDYVHLPGADLPGAEPEPSSEPAFFILLRGMNLPVGRLPIGMTIATGGKVYRWRDRDDLPGHGHFHAEV